MLQVSIPIAHELQAQCIKQGQALMQRASLVGDFSDYESWKSARKQWIDPTVQALEHMYGGAREAREFTDAATCPESSKRWQEQYAADVKCVEEAIDFLTVLQGELAFVEDDGEAAGTAAELTMGEGSGSGEASLLAREQPTAPEYQPEVREARSPAATETTHTSNGAGPGPLVEPSHSSNGAEPTIEPEPVASERVGAELAPAQRVGSQLAPQPEPSGPAEREPASAPAAAGAREVLVTHGRDERWKQAVEHLLEQAGEHEIRILKQRPGERGRLAQLLGEDGPEGRYAVVLLTADDVGGPRLESEEEPYFTTRAHQQVVFEMGFLVASLSPGRVCVLYEDGVELPCELEGISHVRLDLAGTWQPKLLLHLRRAGFDYDLNRLVAA
jgi:predicted nucleotide-binding protein